MSKRRINLPAWVQPEELSYEVFATNRVLYCDYDGVFTYIKLNYPLAETRPDLCIEICGLCGMVSKGSPYHIEITLAGMRQAIILWLEARYGSSAG